MATTTYYDATYGVRAIGLRTDNAGAGVSPDLTAEEDRFESADIAEGYVTADAFEVVEATVWDVTVGSLVTDVDVYAVTGTVAGQGSYLVRMDQAGDTLTIAASDPTDPRIDEIYLVVADNDYDSGTESLPRLAVRGGVAAPTPSAPGVDAEWTASVLLATIDIPAAAADITACTITDERATSQLVVDAATLEGNAAADFAPVVHDHDSDYADLAHVGTTDEHPGATTDVAGFLSPSDKTKLDSIETGADANRSAAELLTDIKTVDGGGSLIDADLLDGQHVSYIDLSAHGHSTRYWTKSFEDLWMDNKSGLVEWIKVKKSASAQALTTGVITDITLDAELFDDWNGHSGSDARVDCDNDGLYLIEVQVQFQSAAAGTYRHIEIYHATDGIIAMNRTTELSGGQVLLQVHTVYNMVAGHGVKIRAKHDYGSNINVDTTNTWLSITKLGGQTTA